MFFNKKKSVEPNILDSFMKFKVDLLKLDAMLKDEPELKTKVSREFESILEQIELIKRHNYMTL